MKKVKKEKNVKQAITRVLTFFLFLPLIFNLVGNFLGISGHYTYYYYGYNSVAILSRIIEDSIFTIGWRIFVLGIVSLVASLIMYFLYTKAKRGRVYAFVIAIILYGLDFALIFSGHYYEGPLGEVVSNFIHLMTFLFVIVLGLLRFLINPVGRGRYDYA